MTGLRVLELNEMPGPPSSGQAYEKGKASEIKLLARRCSDATFDRSAQPHEATGKGRRE
jgi:hypothetical protein